MAGFEHSVTLRAPIRRLDAPALHGCLSLALGVCVAMMGLFGMVLQTASPVQHGVIGHCALFHHCGLSTASLDYSTIWLLGP